MSRGFFRAARVARLDLAFQLRRPLILILLLIVVVSSWGLTTGHLRISSGDASVGGKKAWITSEHSNALGFCFMTLLFYSFFVSVVAGTAVTRDDELRVGEVLHTTGLRPHEYIWGKFAGVLAGFAVVVLVHIAATMFFQHVPPIEDADKIRGPFALGNYLRPVFFFSLPTLLFLTGLTLWIGERTRRPVTVYLFPVGVMLFCAFFLWEWKPGWLDPRIDRILQWIDPSGYRWLDATQLRVDRGVDYYNTQPVRFDADFLLSRAVFAALGLAAVAWSQRHFAQGLRGKHAGRAGRAAVASAPLEAPEPRPLAPLAMRAGSMRFLRQVATVARFEAAGLASSAGLYLFAPLILVQTILNVYFAEGVWGTRLIVTSGNFAVGTLNALTLCTVFLLLFYTVESLDRERATGLGPVYSSTQARTAAILFGKSLANCFVGFVILVAAGLGAVVIMLAQGRTRPEATPFVLVWGTLLVPTLFVWCGFVMATFALVRSKYATYAIAIAILVLSGIMQSRGKMNWAWNWNLWNVARWTDLGVLEPNGLPLVLNRLSYIALGVFFIAFAVRVFERREFDATRLVHRLAPGRLLRSSLRLVPYAIPVIGLGIALELQVVRGFESKQARKRERDYWKQNLATWKDAPRPVLATVDLDVSLEPRQHSFSTRGRYLMYNDEPGPMRQFVLTLGRHVETTKWTLDDSTYVPENRSNLFVFTPAEPLAPGDSVRVGFEFGGRVPRGATRNGGGLREFIQPSGVVLTSFSPLFAPVVGFREDIGVEPKENQYEPRVYPTDFYRGTVKSAFGLARPFATRIRLDGPAEYRLNSVGRLVEEKVAGGRRQALWVSDHPVNFFNIVAGRWSEVPGEGTVIYYHPKHDFNVPEMHRTIDAARRYYSEWFYPYPWEQLKLSEFANLASYAQGFPTNITFSEGIGFLTLSDWRSRMAFMVTAHETAHQWWGNLLVPGEGPGGDLLSEGMAHFSTLLLQEQMNGLQGRIEFAKRIEERYGDERQVDAERPLVRIDGSKAGDRTVTYDKGGWVFWMLHDLMGREANLAALRAFIRNHLDNPDHALLEDFVAELRPFAPDTTAFDAFTKQWFFEVVVPEYRFEQVERARAGTGWVVTGKVQNAGSARMLVELAAVRNDRFVKQTEAEAQAGPAAVSGDYREARMQVTLGAGESSPFRIECDFEPQSVVADPDARVLQLRRKYAIHRF